MRYGLYFVALVQLVGAVRGFTQVQAIVSANGFPTGAAGLLLSVFILVHLLGLAGAILILRQRRLGFSLSIAHQLLIVPTIHVAGVFGYIIMDALAAFILLEKGVAEFGIQVRVLLLKNLSVVRGTSFIGVNLVALICLGLLWRERRRLSGQPAAMALATAAAAQAD
jgi:hypothetical protein